MSPVYSLQLPLIVAKIKLVFARLHRVCLANNNRYPFNNQLLNALFCKMNACLQATLAYKVGVKENL
jgi:hypothetical protein